MNEKIEEVIEFFENRKDLIEAADGLKSAKFIDELSIEELRLTLLLLRLRYIIWASPEEED